MRANPKHTHTHPPLVTSFTATKGSDYSRVAVPMVRGRVVGL